MYIIQALPIDREGNLLFLKDFDETTSGQATIKYKAMISGMHFQTSPVFGDEKGNLVIPDNQGKPLYKFHSMFVSKIMTPETRELYNQINELQKQSGIN